MLPIRLPAWMLSKKPSAKWIATRAMILIKTIMIVTMMVVREESETWPVRRTKPKEIRFIQGESVCIAVLPRYQETTVIIGPLSEPITRNSLDCQ